MKKIHIYKAQSRLGLIHAPYKHKSPNAGVEEGPDAILKNYKFLGDSPVDTYIYSLPEKIQKKKYFQVIACETLEFANLIKETISHNETQVVLGGDHSVSLGSLIALFHRIHPKDVGYIQIDSHADLHNVSTSPSGNFHGMWMRPVVDVFDKMSINSLVPEKLSVSHMLYIGNLDLELEEKIFMDQHHIMHISKKNIRDKSFNSKKIMTSFMNDKKHIHISFDIDSFDQTLACATGMPCQDGLFWEDIEPLLSLLAKHPHISIDMVELNPKKIGSVRTIALARRVLKTLLL